jgi:hypothetical protein
MPNWDQIAADAREERERRETEGTEDSGGGGSVTIGNDFDFRQRARIVGVDYVAAIRLGMGSSAGSDQGHRAEATDCPPPGGRGDETDPAAPPPPQVVDVGPTGDLIGKEIVVVEQNDYQTLPPEYYEQGVTPFQHLGDTGLGQDFIGRPWEDFSEVSDRFRFYCRSFWTGRVESDIVSVSGRGELELRRHFLQHASRRALAIEEHLGYSGIIARPGHAGPLGAPGAWQALEPEEWRRDIANQNSQSPFIISGYERKNIAHNGYAQASQDFLYQQYFRDKITLTAKELYFTDMGFSALHWEEFVKGTHKVIPPRRLRDRQESHSLGVYPYATLEPLIRGKTWYSDFSFRLTLPLLPDEIPNVGLNNISIARWEPKYNFYIEKYESVLKEFFRLAPVGRGHNLEFFLPNMYIFIAERLNETRIDPDFINFLTLGGTIPNTVVEGVFRNGDLVGERSRGAYFNDWAKGFEPFLYEDDDGTLRDFYYKYIRTLFSSAKIENVYLLTPAEPLWMTAADADAFPLQRHNAYKTFFPMYVNLEFSTDRRTGGVADMLAGRYQLMNSLMKDTFRTDLPPISGRPWHLNGAEIVGTENFVYAIDRITDDTTFTEIRLNQPTKVFEFSAWINKYLEGAYPENVGDNVGEIDSQDFGQVVVNEVTPPARGDSTDNFVDIYDGYPEQPLINVGLRYDEITRFSNQLADHANRFEKFRSFSQIMRGELAKSETLFYKIAKHQIRVNGSISTAPDQEIFLPNASHIDVLKYIDTQVVNEKRYKYIVYAYELVWGSSYRYMKPHEVATTEVDLQIHGIDGTPHSQYLDDTAEGARAEIEDQGDVVVAGGAPGEINPVPTQDAPSMGGELGTGVREHMLAQDSPVIVDGEAATFEVEVLPHLKILEIPFFEFNTLVVDKPPLPPSVEIIPFKGVNNRMLFLFQSMTGRMQAHPIIMVADDVERFNIIREGQSLDPGEMLNWEGDDPASAYEVFRITTPPSSYRDFFGSPHRRISAAESVGCGRVLSTAVFEDDLRPNRKYYYTFREIDVHEKPSNPTEVFEVELVDDNGLIFPRIKPYYFPEIKEGESSTTFKRYLLIAPALGQDEVILTNRGSQPPSAADAQIRLGDAEKTIFPPPVPNNEAPDDENKLKFKIRITSKQTGKKIDINVRFRHLHDKELKCS